MSQQIFDKVSVDVVERDQEFYADVDFNNATHLLGPTRSRDEIYSLIFGFISDLRLIAELESKNNSSQDNS